VPVIVAGSGVLVLIVGLVLVGVSASGPPADEGEWTDFTSLDESFTAYYPDGWGEPSNSGSAGSFVSVVWKGSKLCRVEVHGSSGAGTRGDIAAAKERILAGNLGPGEQLPVESTADGALLDSFKRDTWLARRPGYEEGSAGFSYDFAKSRAARVEYTFSKRAGLLSVPMKGIRWASQQGDYGYHVTAEAPAKHWAKFEPVALKIVGGVHLGGAG